MFLNWPIGSKFQRQMSPGALTTASWSKICRQWPTFRNVVTAALALILQSCANFRLSVVVAIIAEGFTSSSRSKIMKKCRICRCYFDAVCRSYRDISISVWLIFPVTDVWWGAWERFLLSVCHLKPKRLPLELIHYMYHALEMPVWMAMLFSVVVSGRNYCSRTRCGRFSQVCSWKTHSFFL